MIAVINFYFIKDADRRHMFFTTVIHTWLRMKFSNSKAAKLFWVFGHNEGTNKKIGKHQSFKEYWNEGDH